MLRILARHFDQLDRSDSADAMPAKQSSRLISNTGWLTQGARLCRLCAHVARGWLQLHFVYPRCTRSAQLAMIRTWSQHLLAILGISIHTASDAKMPATPCMLVANHISWLDIFVIHAHHPVRFIAKSEIRGWPVIGTLCSVTGTLFIERVKRSDAHRINETIVRALDDGDWVGVFPEGFTTDGDVVRHFHANLLQAAITRDTPLQPVALRYRQPDGSRSTAAPYVGEQSLAASLLAILRQPVIAAEIRFLQPVLPLGRSRRELARMTETAIASALELPVVHTPPAPPPGPPA
jgi:1-acyl-sn-glycerol-3-phosphate acyltransferase